MKTNSLLRLVAQILLFTFILNDVSGMGEYPRSFASTTPFLTGAKPIENVPELRSELRKLLELKDSSPTPIHQIPARIIRDVDAVTTEHQIPRSRSELRTESNDLELWTDNKLVQLIKSLLDEGKYDLAFTEFKFFVTQTSESVKSASPASLPHVNGFLGAFSSIASHFWKLKERQKREGSQSTIDIQMLRNFHALFVAYFERPRVIPDESAFNLS